MAEEPKPDAPEGSPEEPKAVEDLKEIDVPEGADENLRTLISKRNSELRNLRERAKSAEEKAKKYDELEESNKSETQKLAEKAKSLEDRASTAETDVLRLRVALRKGLSETQAKRLVGKTEQELEADADELLESFRPADDKGRPTGKPRERLSGGGDPTEDPEEMDAKKLANLVPRY